jgi:hypothetical protein
VHWSPPGWGWGGWGHRGGGTGHGTGGRRSFIVPCHCVDPPIPIFNHDRDDDDDAGEGVPEFGQDLQMLRSCHHPSSDEVETAAAEPHAMPGPFFKPALIIAD